MNDNSLTIGHWRTEEESGKALDDILNRVELRHVHREVEGSLMHPRPCQKIKKLRIDRILMPTRHLIGELGWKHGAIGIEVKKSAEKIGPPIAQAMDYSRTAWPLPGSNVTILLDWVFIWPVERQHGTVASILAQHRIGCAYSNTYTMLHLKSGEHNIIHIGMDGTITVGEEYNGRKVGSR